MGINGYQGNFTFEYGCRKYVCIFRDMFMLPAYIKYNKWKFDSPGKKIENGFAIGRQRCGRSRRYRTAGGKILILRSKLSKKQIDVYGYWIMQRIIWAELPNR